MAITTPNRMQDIQDRIDEISTRQTSAQQLEGLMEIFSETVYNVPYATQGFLEATLKERIYTHIKTYPQDVMSIPDILKKQDKLKDVMNQIQYITKNRFFNRSSFFGCPIFSLKNTRFSHHLSKNLGNLSTMSKGAAYLLGGISLLGIGIGQLQDSTKKWNQLIGGTALGLGSTFIVTPFISAYELSGGENP